MNHTIGRFGGLSSCVRFLPRFCSLLLPALELRPKARRYNSILSTQPFISRWAMCSTRFVDFPMKEGALRLAAASGQLTGKIVADARSGESGGGMHDGKMQKQVFWRATAGRHCLSCGSRRWGRDSPRKVRSARTRHFTVHGCDHELTIPAKVQMAGIGGMKNSSTRFLRVSEAVDIELNASGGATRP